MKKLQFKKIKLNNERWNLFHRTLFSIIIINAIDIIIISLFVKNFRSIFVIALIFYIKCGIIIMSAIIIYYDIERIAKLNYDKKKSENKKV